MASDIFRTLVGELLALKIDGRGLQEVEKRIVTAQQVHAAAILSAGYQLRRLIQEGIKSRAPGDVVWPPLHRWSGGKTLGSRFRGRRRTTEAGGVKFFSRQAAVWPILRRAVRYEAQNEGGQRLSLRARLAGGEFVRVLAGFIGGRAAKFAAAIATGQTIAVTPRMRRFFFARNVPLTAASLRYPPREHVGAVYRKYHVRLLAFVEARVRAAAAGQDPRGIKSMF